MKYLELAERMVNLLNALADLWGWLKQNNYFFEAFILFLS